MVSKEDKIIINKLLDKKKAGISRISHTNFLNSSEISLCLNELKYDNNFILTGGTEENERNIILFYPDYIYDIEDIVLPIKALKITHSNKMSHRDILGSLMGLNIKREMIGDILIYDKYSIIFVLEDISDFIKSNLFKIGRETIDIDYINISDIEKNDDDFKIIKDTVKSIRLDSVVASGFSMSRTKAVEQISAQNVYLNNKICPKADQKVNENDKISIRGKGKIILLSIMGKSKKDRIFIEIKKYN